MTLNPDYGKTATPHIQHVIDSPMSYVEVLIPVDFYDRPEVALFDTLSQYFREEHFEPVDVIAINFNHVEVLDTRTLTARIITTPIGV